MSRPGIHTSMMVGGVLGTTSQTGQFVVTVQSTAVDPLTLHLTKDEASQWAQVLTEYAVTP